MPQSSIGHYSTKFRPIVPIKQQILKTLLFKATACELFYETNPVWTTGLCKFGEISIVRDAVRIGSKLKT
jgi:hypothetical protein